jgi:hypothetical protein
MQTSDSRSASVSDVASIRPTQDVASGMTSRAETPFANPQELMVDTLVKALKRHSEETASAAHSKRMMIEAPTLLYPLGSGTPLVGSDLNQLISRFGLTDEGISYRSVALSLSVGKFLVSISLVT